LSTPTNLLLSGSSNTLATNNFICSDSNDISSLVKYTFAISSDPDNLVSFIKSLFGLLSGLFISGV